MFGKYENKLCDSDSGSGLQLHIQSSPGERSDKFSQNGKFVQNGMSGQKGKVHLGPNVSSSAHYRGCVVNGSGAMAQYEYYYYLIHIYFFPFLYNIHILIYYINFFFAIPFFSKILSLHE